MKKQAFHCPTKQSMIYYAKKCKRDGAEVHKDLLDGLNWNMYKENTYVDIENNRMGFCNKEYYEEEGYTLIPFKKKLEYGFFDESDVLIDIHGVERKILKIEEDGVWVISVIDKEKAIKYFWDELKDWKIKGQEETVTVRMPKSKFDIIKNDDMEVIE